MKQSYEHIAQAILDIIGIDNIQSVTHCATRLRFIVNDREAIDDKKIEAVDEVKGVFYTSGQYQIILGTGIVNKVYACLESMNLHTISKQEQDQAIKSNEKGIKRLMRTLADIFIPIIPVIAATGLFLGLKGCIFNDNILQLFGMNTTMIPQYIQTLVSVLTETAFAFLPAIICWSAFKVFKGTPVIGLVIGLMLVSPILPNAYSVADPNSGVNAIMAFGSIPIVGCQGSVLTAILTAFLGANLERKLRNIMPNALDLIFTPFIVMFVMLLVVLLGIGPIMHNIELGMVSIIEQLIHLPLGIGGFIIGFTYPLAVITGLHHTYVMIETSLLANTGFNPLITLCAMYGFANVGSCLAFYVRSKKKSIKATSMGAMLSQLFGISEPVLFGILLRFNLKPLMMMLITSGIGAAILSIFSIQSNAYGLAVLPSYLMYIYNGNQILLYSLVSLFAVICCFLLTYLFAIPKEILENDEQPQIAIEMPQHIVLEDTIAPANGILFPLEEVNDPMFSTKALGDGYAIKLLDGTIVSPMDGIIETVFPSKHAIGIRNQDGMEILIHIGIDTVQLNGNGFNLKIQQGDHVKQGDPLVHVDLDLLKQEQKDSTTMIIFTSKELIQCHSYGKKIISTQMIGKA